MIWSLSLPQTTDWPDQAGSGKRRAKAVRGKEPNQAYQNQAPRTSTTMPPTPEAAHTILRQRRASTTSRCPAKTGMEMPWASALALHKGEQTKPNSSMHLGQIGLPHMRHFSNANWPGCFRQGGAA